MTLVEVIGGLALLSILAMTLLSISSQQARQHQTAGRVQEAVRAADQLMLAWWQQPHTLTKSDSGDIDGAFAMKWRRQVIGQYPVTDTTAPIVRLEILDASQNHTGEKVLAYIEILAPPTPAPGSVGSPGSVGAVKN